MCQAFGNDKLDKEENQHILVFDGVKGVIFDPNGEQEFKYAWSLGVFFNNQAKALALWKGLQIAKNN